MHCHVFTFSNMISRISLNLLITVPLPYLNITSQIIFNWSVYKYQLTSSQVLRNNYFLFFWQTWFFMKGHMDALQDQHFSIVCLSSVCIPHPLHGFRSLTFGSCDWLPCFMRLSRELLVLESVQWAIPTTVILFGSQTQSSSSPTPEAVAGNQAVSYPCWCHVVIRFRLCPSIFFTLPTLTRSFNMTLSLGAHAG